MKKNHIVFLLFFAVSHTLLSQNLENLWNDGFLSTTNKVHYNSTDNSWIVAGVFYDNQNNSFFTKGETYLSKVDTIGIVIWKTSSSSIFPNLNVVGLEVLSNDNIILLSSVDDCDVGLPDSLTQYSTNGVELSKIESPISYPSSITAVDNNRFVLTSFDKILLMDNSWNILWTHQLADFSYNTSIHQAPNGNIFAFTANKVLNLDINTGVPYNTYPSNTKFVAAQEGAFFYVISETESVALMDTSFNFGFASFSIADDFDEVYKAQVIQNNRIAVHGKKNGRTNIKLFDSGFTLIDSIDWDVEHLFINDFNFNHNRIAVAGSDFSVKHPTQLTPQYLSYYIDEGSTHSFLKTFDYSLNSNIIGVNAGVTDISYDNYSTTFDSCGTFYYNHNFTINDISITIKNYGTQTINYLKLFSRQTPNCPAFCPLATFHTFDIDTISLAPNASTTIHINQIEVPLQFASAPFDFCFWTGEVNHQIDIEHSNDKYCLPLYSNTTHQDRKQPVIIYPNPSSNQINLELPPEFTDIQFEIINATGQIIKIENTRNIDISGLANGFYIVQGTNEDGKIFIGKFIKN